MHSELAPWPFWRLLILDLNPAERLPKRLVNQKDMIQKVLAFEGLIAFSRPSHTFNIAEHIQKLQ